MTAKALGFDRPTANSLDSVADRDFVLETLSAAAICAVHLSRLAEEIVLWATPHSALLASRTNFRRARRSCRKAQSRRGAAYPRQVGPDYRRAQRLAYRDEGLPLAYSKDLQEDKEGTFDALHSLSLCMAAMTGMAGDLTPDLKRMKTAAGLAMRPRPISPIGWCGP